MRAVAALATALLVAGMLGCTGNAGTAARRAEPVEDGGSGADPAVGERIAREVCGRCHALEDDAPSPHPAAPPFPVLARRFPGETLLPRLEEGIRASHPDMPEVRLAPAEIDPFLAYWATQ